MGSRKDGYNSLRKIAGELLISSISEYSNNRSLLTFLCSECNVPFTTTGFLYKKSLDGKRCIKCKQKLAVNSSSARDSFIEKCKEIHGGYYDYRLVPDHFRAIDPIIIICPKHGEIQTTADRHKNQKSGCQRCHIENITTTSRSDKVEFTLKANHVHNFKYQYDKVVYVNAKTPVIITCPKHGDFEQTPDVHLRRSGCRSCNSTSQPVQEITNVLDKHGIYFSTEKMFEDCIGVGNRPLRFDIFIPGKNLLVEYDGVHHFQPTTYSRSITDEQAFTNFQIQQQNDEIKNKYCEENHINLIRIPYTDHHPGATLLQYISEQEDERFVYTWTDFRTDVTRIVNNIKTFNYERFAVYGVSRGGLPFAVNVSNHFGGIAEFGIVKFQRYDGNDTRVDIQSPHTTHNIPIFVIDDLISSGITMNRVVRTLQHQYKKATIHPIVIFGEDTEDDILFIREHPKQWIVFPYEL